MSLLKLKKWLEHEIAETKKIDGDFEIVRRHNFEDVLGQIDSYKAKPRKPKFVKPEYADLYVAFRDKGVSLDQAGLEAVNFINHYESCGWVIGANGKKMVSWKHSVAGWIARNKQKKDDRHSARIRDTTDDGYQPVFNRSEKGKPVRIGE